MQESRVRSSRDDKVEGVGTPEHEWMWMDRFKKANLGKSDFRCPMAGFFSRKRVNGIGYFLNKS
jgi:hypothetical protein